MTLTQFIYRIVAKIRKRNIYTAQVVSVDEQKLTCTVKIDDALELTDVRLTAVIDSLQSPCYCIPKVGSAVTCATLEDDESEAVIIKFSEVEKVVMNGGLNGEVINWSVLQTELNKLKARQTTLETAIDSAPVAPGDGGASFKAALITALNANTINPNKDSKFKH
jgi:hypothetical protein